MERFLTECVEKDKQSPLMRQIPRIAVTRLAIVGSSVSKQYDSRMHTVVKGGLGQEASFDPEPAGGLL
jgi:hypothetical protein